MAKIEKQATPVDNPGVRPPDEDPCSLYVGRLILRPAKITPAEFVWLDPLVMDSKDRDKLVVRAKSGRERGYFANGMVALSTTEDVRGLAVITSKAGWHDDWVCLEVTGVSDTFVKAIVSPVERERVEKYYAWVYAHPEITNISFDLWRSRNF